MQSFELFTAPPMIRAMAYCRRMRIVNIYDGAAIDAAPVYCLMPPREPMPSAAMTRLIRHERAMQCRPLRIQPLFIAAATPLLR